MRNLFTALLFWLLSGAGAAAVMIEDSRGAHEFNDPPERVVALTWSLVEQLLELDVVPVGVADVDGYRQWVARPPLPEDIVDVGLRQEPAIERIAELQPDLILASDDQLAFVPQLERIAPVLHFDAFRADHDNEKAARLVYRTLAKLFEREALAARRLTELDGRLDTLRREVHDHFEGAPPPVTIVRFIDQARLVIHGANAMPVHALEALGVKNAGPDEPTQWGIVFKRIEELGRHAPGAVLYVEPVPDADEIFSRPIWQAMPFVRSGQVGALPVTWTYGGAMSVGYLAEEIARALKDLPVQ